MKLDPNLLDLYEGDCLDHLKAVPSASVDLVFTSPPYAEQRSHEYGGIEPELYVSWFIPIAREIRRILKPEGSFFLNLKAHCSKGSRNLYVYQLVIALSEIVRLRFMDEYVWYKSATPRIKSPRLWDAWEPIWFFSRRIKPYINYEAIKIYSKATFGNKRGFTSFNKVTGNVGGYHDIADQHCGKTLPDNVLYFPTALLGKDTQFQHPAKFPIELAEFIVRGYCPPGGTVCDPFVGSGVTALAALCHGCRCIAMDLEPEYCQMARDRIASWSPPPDPMPRGYRDLFEMELPTSTLR